MSNDQYMADIIFFYRITLIKKKIKTKAKIKN